jgi:hypothetical protein
MMIRATIFAALAAATLAFAAPGAQAMPADAGLSTSTTALVQTVRWHPRHHSWWWRHHHSRRWWRHHRRHRVCRVRRTVRWHHGHRVVRTVRRCY